VLRRLQPEKEQASRVAPTAVVEQGALELNRYFSQIAQNKRQIQPKPQNEGENVCGLPFLEAIA